MNIAVIGGGISGLAAAWLLNQKHQVTLFESADYLGGHTHTVDVMLDGMVHPVDTGFLVHNTLTYPNLIQLFDHLGVETYESDMSFSVRVADKQLEWAGTHLGTVFGQSRNLVRPAFWRMVSDILKFNDRAEAHLEWAEAGQATLGQLLEQCGYSSSFRDWYLLPMAAAIWSSSPKDILNFPASTFLHFCLNHRLLQVNDRPQWRTIVGGGRSYVEKMAGELDVRLSASVTSVRRSKQGAHVVVHDEEQTFDAVVLATHAPESLAMLVDATPQERTLLRAIPYQQNTVVLHTDARFLPERKRLWSAWNYLNTSDSKDALCVTYWLNKLQNLPFKQPVLVTLNPPSGFEPEHPLAVYDYEHPVFDQAAIHAQKQLADIQGEQKTWFCGAWCGYGFHEDGLKSALRVVADFDVEVPWTVQL